LPCSPHGGIEGFHVFCGNRISPDDETAMENLARTIIWASFSQERMQYLDHIPNRGEHNGQVIWLLQQRLTGKTAEGR